MAFHHILADVGVPDLAEEYEADLAVLEFLVRAGYAHELLGVQIIRQAGGEVAELEQGHDALVVVGGEVRHLGGEPGGGAQAQANTRFAPRAYSPARPAFFRNLSHLCTRYGYRTGLASALNFSQAAVVYGALALMALVILPEMKVPAADLPLYYFLGNVAALVGGLTGAHMVEACGRRPTLVFSYSLTVLATLPLYFFQTLPGMVLSYCLMQFGVTWAYITAYVIAAEILPTHLRATGLGLSVAVGRVGAMLAPLLLTFAYQTSGSAGPALMVLILLASPGPIAAILWRWKGVETRNLSLEHGSNEEARSPTLNTAAPIATTAT